MAGIPRFSGLKKPYCRVGKSPSLMKWHCFLEG